MEEGKGEDKDGGNGGQALAMQESDSCTTLVIVINLLRYISHHDKVPPLRVIERTPATTGSGDLAPGCSPF